MRNDPTPPDFFKNFSEWLAFTMASGNVMSWLWWGSDLVEISRQDKRQYGTALRIHATMDLETAIARAPDTYARLKNCRTAISLLTAIERYLEKVSARQPVTVPRPNTISTYADLVPSKLQHLARLMISLRKTHPNEMASLSLITYALLGLADELKDHIDDDNKVKCGLCYRTAILPNQYCQEDQASDLKIFNGAKIRNAPKNLTVARRWRRRVQKIATGLRKNPQSVCYRLLRQLFGMSGALNPLPLPLETLPHDEFATGARIGPNGGQWFIYLWENLPHVRELLGPDWIDLVMTAMNDEEWCFVLRRLDEIDPYKKSTDARQWVLTLIDAEEWLQATEIERQQRHRRGRPGRDPANPKIQKALAQLNGGVSPEQVAERAGVSVSTVYRWRKWQTPTTAHSFRRNGRYSH